uniref:Uncharacterized protein n=1 Tax=Anopheles coluzzii TaxID=1518534 RepID=A0A8W7PH98_ANOCL
MPPRHRGHRAVECGKCFIGIPSLTNSRRNTLFFPNSRIKQSICRHGYIHTTTIMLCSRAGCTFVDFSHGYTWTTIIGTIIVIIIVVVITDRRRRCIPMRSRAAVCRFE